MDDTKRRGSENEQSKAGGPSGSAEKKKKKKGGVLQWIILFLILTVLFYSGFSFLREFMTYREAENEYAQVNSLIDTTGDAGLEWLEMETAQEATVLYAGGQDESGVAYPGTAGFTGTAGTGSGESASGQGSAGSSGTQEGQGDAAAYSPLARPDDQGASAGSRLSQTSGAFLTDLEALWSRFTGFLAGLFGLEVQTPSPASPGDAYMTALQSGENVSAVQPSAAQDETKEEAAAAEPSSEEAGADKKEETKPREKKVYITYPRVSIDYDELMAINSDFVGVLYMPALQLKYPIAHSHDNAEYLKRTFEGTNNPAGSIFMDVSASPDYSDRNTFIFGHNMRNLSMFGSLKTLQTDDTICPKHPYFYIYTKNRVYKYAIFAYYTVPTKDDMYLDFRGDDGYDAYINKAIERSLFTPAKGAVDFSKRPNLVTLSTCYGSGHVLNFVVQGALQGTAEQNPLSNAR